MTIKPGSGPEGRLVAEFLTRRRRNYHYRVGGISDLWMMLARKYRRPIREVKEIVARYREQERTES